MKLQVDGDQLRLRLTEAELARLGVDGELEQAVPCPDGTAVRYRLRLLETAATAACAGNLMDLLVVLPRGAFLAFAAERPRRDGFAFACGPLRVTVEVDVRDSHRVRRTMSPPAGQSDAN
jgi:hypothetical protein